VPSSFKAPKNFLQFAGNDDIVISKYPNILTPRHFITANEVGISAEVGFISAIDQLEPSVLKRCDDSRRII
jgi:hypothetical protein